MFILAFENLDLFQMKMTHLSPKIKILILGEEYHARAFSDQLKNYENGVFEPKYTSELTNEPHLKNYDLFHLISTPLPLISKLSKYGQPILYHWIGTDVYRFIKDSYIKRQLKKYFILSPLVKNLVVWNNLKNELSQFNVNSTVLPLVEFSIKKDIPPLPKKFSILTYVPFKRWEYYNGDMILKLAEALPEIDFHILAFEEKRINLHNVHTYGFVRDITPFYKNSSVLIRITKHDGLAKMVIEALSYGRQVMRNMPFPHCILVNNLEDCISTINSLKKKQELNLAGKAFVEQNFNQQKILDNYYHLCKSIIKQYQNEV